MATVPTPALEHPTDGRVRRAARSRAAIEDALFALVGEGNLQPTVQEVATRAGMAMRSVFRHFSDMESLFASIDTRLRREALALLREPDPRVTLRVRVAALARQRARLFEHIAPYKRAGDLQRWRSPYVQTQQELLVAELRERLRAWLPELTALAPAVQEAVELVLSFEAWERLRRWQRLGVTRAVAVLERTVTTLLLAAPPAPRRTAGTRRPRKNRR
jgi:AcrR family transcriptional regulator